MKSTYYIVILVLFSIVILHPQDVNSTNFNNFIPTTLKQIENNLGVKTLLSAITNQANIEQVGNYNNASITQNLNSTSSNFASIIQNNNSNTAVLLKPVMETTIQFLRPVMVMKQLRM